MWRRTVATLLLASHTVSTTGCTSWQLQSDSVTAVVAARPELQQTDTSYTMGASGRREMHESRRSIRIATTSQPKLTEVGTPHVANDSLFGVRNQGSTETGTPLGDVTAVQVRKVSAGRTVGLAAVVAVFAGLVIGMVGLQNSLE
jgi:hypothetical protein